ncbi:MAG TPA: hypothetical protein VH251_09375 [Verrucomicrobiae bacterium]|jgi:hypothetical protein|nr:hypothetical protein [Verrucomicrobiae bacterium]
MRAYFHSFAAVVLLMTISAAKAIPVYGTFSGIVTYSAQTSDGYYTFAYGTPVTGSYEYSPDLLIGGSTAFADPTAYFQIDINGQYLQSWGGNLLNLSVDANGVPVSGSGIASWDLHLASGSAGMDAGVYFIDAQVTYSTPSYADPAVPDTASTACLTSVAMLSLIAFGRLISRPRKDRTSAR